MKNNLSIENEITTSSSKSSLNLEHNETIERCKLKAKA